jgi:hypothetical protein
MLFDALEARRSDIESALGGEVSWERLDGRRACRIARYRWAANLTDESHWKEYQWWMIQQLALFRSALQPYLDQLPASNGPDAA